MKHALRASKMMELELIVYNKTKHALKVSEMMEDLI